MPALEQLLAAAIVSDYSQRPVTAANQLVEANLASHAAARTLVAELRAAGYCAIEGPGTPAHRVGWQRRAAPTWFANNACVCFPWSEFDRGLADVVIEINPAGGFGAGSHPTTLLVLEELAGQRQLGRVLDVGCGTGVLSVAAALFGAEEVTAIDIVESAVLATRSNAASNGVGGLVTALDSPIQDVAPSYHTIVANIHAPVLIEMAADLLRLLAPRGTIALSGMSKAQVSTIKAAFAPLVVSDERRNNDWAALILTER